MSLFQTFDKNAKKLKVAFLSILPFGTKLGGLFRAVLFCCYFHFTKVSKVVSTWQIVLNLAVP